MEKINVELLAPNLEKYEDSRREYIATYEEYRPGSLFSPGYYVKRPDSAEAHWNRDYPRGFPDWREAVTPVRFSDLETLVNKINEVIDVLSSKKP